MEEEIQKNLQWWEKDHPHRLPMAVAAATSFPALWALPGKNMLAGCTVSSASVLLRTWWFPACETLGSMSHVYIFELWLLGTCIFGLQHFLRFTLCGKFSDIWCFGIFCYSQQVFCNWHCAHLSRYGEFLYDLTPLEKPMKVVEKSPVYSFILL